MCIFLFGFWGLFLGFSFRSLPPQWVNYTWKNGEGRENKKKEGDGKRKKRVCGAPL